MTIRQLEYFCAVAEGRSISAAARALHVAQPPISRQIAQLEAELGVQLFARESRGMKLTEAGQALYRQSRSLFLNLRRVEENVRSIGAGEGGRINVGVIYSAMPYALHYLEAYHARYPKVEFYIRLGSPQDLLNDLDRSELHVLFLRRSTQESGSLHERILGEDVDAPALAGADAPRRSWTPCPSSGCAACRCACCARTISGATTII